jgi:hypothetical protein
MTVGFSATFTGVATGAATKAVRSGSTVPSSSLHDTNSTSKQGRDSK